MAEVTVSAHWEDQVSPGIKTMSDNVGRASADAKRTTDNFSSSLAGASKQGETLSSNLSDLAGKQRVTEQATTTASTRLVQLADSHNKAATATDLHAKVSNILQSSLVRQAAAMALSVVGIQALVSEISNSIREAEEQEKAVARLNVAMQLSGQFTTGAATRFREWADVVSRSTALSNNMVISLAALGVNLGLSEGQTKKFAQAAIELGAVTGTGPDFALKALVGTLSGQFTREINKVIPEVHQLTDAQLRAGDAIDLVLQKYQGTAAGIATPLEKMKNSAKLLEESYGNLILTLSKPLVGSGTLGIIGGLTEAMNDLGLATEKVLSAFESLGKSKVSAPNTQELQGFETTHLGPITVRTHAATSAPQEATSEDLGLKALKEAIDSSVGELNAHLKDTSAIVAEYAKAFSPEEAGQRTLALLESGKTLTDAQNEVAEILKKRQPVEDLIAQSAKDWAKMLAGDADRLNEADSEAAKQAREMAERFKKSLPEPVRFDVTQMRQFANAPTTSNLPTAQAQRGLENMYATWLKGLNRADAKLQENIRLADELGQGIAGALVQGILHAQNFGDALRQIFEQVLSSLANTGGSMLGRLLSGVISGGLSGGPAGAAAGAAFSLTGPMGAGNIQVGVQGEVVNELRAMRNDLRQRMPDVNQAQINKAVAVALLPELRKLEARR